MADLGEQATLPMAAISKAMIRLHKEQFGRGPTRTRSYFAGPDTLVCVLDDVLLPAERKMVDMGDAGRVRESRISFQAATAEEFVSAVEHIVGRKVRAFASGVDPAADVAFETFSFESPASSRGEPHGTDGS